LLVKNLPAAGQLATAPQLAAVVALARLRDKEAVQAYVDGALAAVEKEPGRVHTSIVATGLRAGALLGDARVAKVALDRLRSDDEHADIDPYLAEVLEAVAPLELVPVLREVLRAKKSRHEAREQALELVAAPLEET